MKKAFTLIEMVIVLLVVGVLMAATMRFGSGRIVDLKAQSIKEQFVGYYNEIYGQNMTSSFRDGKKYEQLTVILHT
jgi:prepilin-type N-terminal cleavage/methylation domain-containing protein